MLPSEPGRPYMLHHLAGYVDDGYVSDAFSADAQAELERLNAAFKIEIKDAHFFLGNNIDVMAQVGTP